MPRLSSGVVVTLLAVAVAVGFGAGRWTASKGAGAPPDDMAAAMRAALAESDVLDRLERTTRLLQHLGPDDLPEVVAIYDDMLAVLDQWDVRPFIVAWSRIDPAAAFDHALGWPNRIKQQVGTEAAIHGWALRDPMAARLAYEQAAVDYRHLDDGLFFSLLSGWVGSGGSGIERYLADLSVVKRTRATARTIGAIVRQRGTEATLRWADAILREASYHGEFKETVFRNSSRSVARLDPERAAAWAVEHAGQTYAADGPRVVAEQWATRDGGAAMDWLREWPDGTPRDQGVREAFVEWMRSDPDAAKAWLDAGSLTAFHDPAIDAYARLRDARVPEEAIGWCERILDPELRLPCLQAAATEWYRQDAVAAETWLQQSPLSEEARRAVRTPPSRGKRVGPAARAPRAEAAKAAGAGADES
jgi:hypothetical protein